MPRNQVFVTPTLYTNFGTVTKAVIDTSNGNVLSFVFTSVNASLRYFQLFNTNATPVAATTVPVFSFKVPAGGATAPAYLTIDNTLFALNGYNFTTGIGWAVSTTQSSFTDAATASDHDLHLFYQ